MSLQSNVEERKKCYLEKVLKGEFLKHGAWDGKKDWKDEANWTEMQKEWYQGDGGQFNEGSQITRCDAIRHQLPFAKSCEDIKYVKLLDNGSDFNVKQAGAIRVVQRIEYLTRVKYDSEIFPWFYFSSDSYWQSKAREKLKEEYWSKMLYHSIEHLNILKDTADFHANHLLRILYLYGEIPSWIDPIWRKPKGLENIDAILFRGKSDHFPKSAQDEIESSLLNFKYWMDEPPSSIDEPDLYNIRLNKVPTDDLESEMTFWSENHIILFSTAEYLSAQWFYEKTFKPGGHLKLKGQYEKREFSGKERLERGKKRINKWLNDRIQFGFSEWNAPGYYQEDIMALLNLVDFCIDEYIQTKAAIVLDTLIFDLARFTLKGNFGVTAGRCYLEEKNCGWSQPVGDLIEIIFGTRNGIFDSGESPVATYFVSSNRYQVPNVLITIGQDNPIDFIDRTRVSIGINEAIKYGIGFETEEDIIFWWSKAAYYNHFNAKSAIKWIRKYRLEKTNPFRRLFEKKIIEIKDIPFNPFFAIPLHDFIISAMYGPILSRANIYTYKSKNALVSSVQNFNTGLISFQSHFCQATLGMGAVVWSNKPYLGGDIIKDLGVSHDGPNYWTGSAVIPRIVQKSNTAIIIYSGDYNNELIHIWFPKDAFNFVSDFEVPNNTNNLDGRWVFGHLYNSDSNSYIGVYSAKTPYGYIKIEEDNLKKKIAELENEISKESTALVDDESQKKEVLENLLSELKHLKSPFVTKEILADGDEHILIIQVGSQIEYESFEKFKKSIISSFIEVGFSSSIDIPIIPTIQLTGLWCVYDIPRYNNNSVYYERLELHYTDNKVRFKGKDFSDDSFPRFENPYIHRKNSANPGTVKWGQHYYTIKLDGNSLTHDCRALEYRNKNKKLDVYRYLDRQDKETYSINTIKIKIEPGLKPYADADSDIYFDIGPVSGKIISNDPTNRNLDESVDIANIPQFWPTIETELDTLEIPFQEADILWFRFYKKDNPWKVLLRELLTKYNPTQHPDASLEERLVLIIQNYNPTLKQEKSPELQKIEAFIAADERTKFHITMESPLDRAKRFLDDSWLPGKITIFLDDLLTAEVIVDRPLTPKESYLIIPFNVKDGKPAICAWNEQIWFGNQALGSPEIQFAKSMSMQELTGTGVPIEAPDIPKFGEREDPGPGFGTYEKPGSFGAYEKPGDFGGRENPGSFGARENPYQTSGYAAYESPNSKDNLQNFVAFDPNLWIASQIFSRIVIEGVSVNQFADLARIEMDGIKYIYAFYNVEIEYMEVNGQKIEFAPDRDIEHPRFLRVGYRNRIDAGGNWLANPGELVTEFAEPFQRLWAAGQLVWNFHAGGFYELLVHRRSDILFKEKKHEWDV